MTDNLTPDVRQLLEALRDAMNVPLPALTEDAERAHLRVAQDRIMTAHVALNGVLDNGHEPEAAAEYTAARTAEVPVTYETWDDSR